MAVEGAIFDQDGLLFDTEVVFARAWKRAGAEMGLSVPDELTVACCGCGTDRLPDVIRRFFPDLDVPTFVRRAFDIVIRAQLSMSPVLKPGVREILACCRQRGLRTAVASSSLRRLVERNVRVAGIAECFDVIVTGADVARGKPAPDIFLLAAERLGVAPANCVVFEDAPTGILAAHAAGCRPVMVPDRVPPTADIRAICTCRASLAEAIADLG